MLNTTNYPAWQTKIREAQMAHEEVELREQRQAEAEHARIALFVATENKRRARLLFEWLGIDVPDDATWNEDNTAVTLDGFTFTLLSTQHIAVPDTETDMPFGGKSRPAYEQVLVEYLDNLDNRVLRLHVHKALPEHIGESHYEYGYGDPRRSHFTWEKINDNCAAYKQDWYRVEIAKALDAISANYDAIIAEWPAYLAASESKRKNEIASVQAEIADTQSLEQRLAEIIRDIVRDVLAEQREY